MNNLFTCLLMLNNVTDLTSKNWLFTFFSFHICFTNFRSFLWLVIYILCLKLNMK